MESDGKSIAAWISRNFIYFLQRQYMERITLRMPYESFPNMTQICPSKIGCMNRPVHEILSADWLLVS